MSNESPGQAGKRARRRAAVQALAAEGITIGPGSCLSADDLEALVAATAPVTQPPPAPAAAPGARALIDDPSMGACSRSRPGCQELGPYKPFYRSYICAACVAADQADILAGRWPFTRPPADPAPPRDGA